MSSSPRNVIVLGSGTQLQPELIHTTGVFNNTQNGVSSQNSILTIQASNAANSTVSNNIQTGCTIVDSPDSSLLQLITPTYATTANVPRPAPSRESNYIYQVLKELDEGQWVLKCWDVKQNPKNRTKIRAANVPFQFSVDKVANLVILHEVNRTKSYVITGERLDELATSAVECFPNHVKQTFYSPWTPGKNSNGVFYKFSHKLRLKAKAYGFHETPDPTPTRSSDDTDTYSLSDLEPLQNLVTSADKNYIAFWVGTAPDDKLEFYKNNCIPKILQFFPNLQQHFPLDLFNADFKLFFEKPDDLFQKNWSQIAMKIKQCVNDERKKEKYIQGILKVNLSPEDRQSHEELESAKNRRSLLKITSNTEILSLIILPYLFTKVNKGPGKTGNWYPEKEEVQNTFLYYRPVKSDASITQTLNDVRDSLPEIHLKRKCILYPCAVILGDSLNITQHSYVLIGNHEYKVESPQEAVDYVFKCTKVLHAKFSKICSHVWEFLENQIYGFEVFGMNRTMSKVIDKLREIKLNNTVPAMFPLLESVLELTLRNGLEYVRGIICNRCFVIKSLFFEWFFEFWIQPKVRKGYVETVRRLSKQCNAVFTQKLLHKIQ